MLWPPALWTWLRARLADRRLPYLLALFAVVLCLPALAGGLQLDDQLLRMRLKVIPSLPGVTGSPMDLFAFIDGDPTKTHAQMDVGSLPWWTLETLRISFWRPVAVVTHLIDHQLWPGLTWLMHLHSLLWYGAVVFVATLFYRRFIGPGWGAGLAALLFAVDDAHGMAAGWLANRNALLAAFFGLLAMLAHDRWRREGWRPGAVIAPLTLLVALLSAEAAAAFAGYFFAYALFLDQGTVSRRLATLAPAALLIVSWRLCYHALGYGAAGSGLYIDPVRSPLEFAWSVFEYVPVLLLGLWGMVPSDFYFVLTLGWQVAILAVATGFLGVLTAALAPALWREPLARFFAVGMLLSIVPFCATFPMDRNLLIPGLGAMGLVALFLERVSRGERPALIPAFRRFVVPVAMLLVVVHLVVAPLLLPPRTLTFKALDMVVARCADSVPEGEAIRSQHILVVNAPDMCARYVAVMRVANGLPAPKHTHTLAAPYGRLRVTRPDAFTLLVRPENGLFSRPSERLFRGLSTPLDVDVPVLLSGMTVTVTALTPDRRPAEVAFRFSVPLEDPSLLWMKWRFEGLESFHPPSVGETIDIQPAF